MDFHNIWISWIVFLYLTPHPSIYNIGLYIWKLHQNAQDLIWFIHVNIDNAILKLYDLLGQYKNQKAKITPWQKMKIISSKVLLVWYIRCTYPTPAHKT